MKFKLDENFGHNVQQVFLDRGHDAVTVRDEDLGGAKDRDVLTAAVAEGRLLVTMDQDFGNVIAFPPERTAGIAVINIPVERPCPCCNCSLPHFSTRWSRTSSTASSGLSSPGASASTSSTCLKISSPARAWFRPR
jgi:hypothetical protein